MFLPLKKGVVHREAVHGYDPKRDGPLARPWILFTFAESAMPFDYPMLFALDRQPTGLEVWSHEYLKIRFGDERRAATVVQIHPFGASRLDKARDCGHPVTVRGTLLEKLCPTFDGFYEAVRGESVEYALPLSRYRNHTLAPVAVKNHPLGTTLTQTLTDTLTSGQYLTFGGDDHYDPTTSIDSLHDLRIMA